jgi:NosR/NirI family nitrous oxide reductase transcriptional regulator
MNTSIMKSAKLVSDALGLPLQPQPALTPMAAAADLQLPPEQPLWVERWQEQKLELVLLCIALFLLMVILFFQDLLVVRPVLFQRVRIGYLLFTLLFLGVYCKAQLSVINLVAFMRVMFGGFTWETLLIDPIIFLLWGFVAVSIILWGRGVFCGWLCPFGALQELIHKVGEHFELPTWEFPAMVHERLWAIKYFILIALVGLSLESMHYAAMLTEVEPFKTVFVMRFEREIWFVAWALLLMSISLFNSKFYCKYLCPLGAGLSFFTRFRIFDWLRRRKECGKPCQSCAAQCQISAIKPTGEIIDNECHYCLECQVTYWDDHRCPPIAEKRKRREGRKKRTEEFIASDSSSD